MNAQADTTPPDSEDAVGWGAVVQTLGAAVGLGAYVYLAGGVAEWSRMAGAGLPASQALAAIEPVSLLASGFRVLVLVPMIMAAALVATQVSADLAAAPHKPRAVVVLGRGGQIATEVVIVLAALYAALVPMALIIGLLGAAAGSSALATLVAAAGVAAVLVGLGTCLPSIIGRDPLGGPRVPDAKRVGTVPAVFSTAVRRLGSLGPRGLAVAAAVTALPLALNAIGAAASGTGRDPGLAIEVYVAGLVLLLIIFAGVLLALAGGLVLRTAMTRDVADAVRAREANEADEQSIAAVARARSTVLLVIGVVAALFVLPLSWAVLVVSIALATVLVDRLPTARAVRIVVISLVFALGFMAYEAHTPQRFDRLEFSVLEPGNPQPRRVRVALIGSRGDDYVVAACDRERATVFDQPVWRSTRPVLLRFPKEDLVGAEVVSRRYAFFEPHELSLAGAVLSMMDVGRHVGALLPAGTNFGPFAASATRDVCGGVSGSATAARAAARAG